MRTILRSLIFMLAASFVAMPALAADSIDGDEAMMNSSILLTV